MEMPVCVSLLSSQLSLITFTFLRVRLPQGQRGIERIIENTPFSAIAATLKKIVHNTLFLGLPVPVIII